METKFFKYWSRQAIADRFGLERTSDCPYLSQWLNEEVLLTDQERMELARLQAKLKGNVDLWNEQELIIKFIALLIDMVDRKIIFPVTR